MTRPVDPAAPRLAPPERAEAAAPAGVSAPAGAPGPAGPRATASRELATATREFEAIFVRSLLANTSIAGKGDAYGGMAVDALAKSVTAGPGLGLGELIRRAVEKNSASPLKSEG